MYRSESDSFAVVVNTFRRNDLLKSSLEHYTKSCGKASGISQIFVVWADQDNEPPSLDEILHGHPPNLRVDGNKIEERLKGPPVKFLKVQKDSLNSRFLPIEDLETDAVFMVDDDIRVDCHSLELAFEAWRYHPDAMVGFYPRLLATENQVPLNSGAKNEEKYHTWPGVFGRHRFNVILTKASFFHRKYLAMYHDKEQNPKEILDFVDNRQNCEDIAMSFMVGRQTISSMETERKEEHCNSCPLYVQGKIRDMGLFNGISTGSGHMKKRSECIDFIIEAYQKRGWDSPLSDLDLGDHSWIHHKFWWQYSPSNPLEWASF